MPENKLVLVTRDIVNLSWKDVITLTIKCSSIKNMIERAETAQ